MRRRMQSTGRIGLVAVLALTTAAAGAGSLAAQLTAPNPYRAMDGWGQLPDGRTWGATSAVYPAPDGEHIWVGERCGANLCVESDVDPILLFDTEGNVVRSFGSGLIAWPHGMFVEEDGSVWVADAVGYAPVPEGWGHVVYKFSPEGEVLMVLGEKGVAGDGPHHFNKPSDIIIAPDGSIFVADGHDAGGNNRIVKFAPDGTFLMEWGRAGTANGEFLDPHALAMDSQGRLFVGDRGNSRVQVFDQEGNHLETWHQFGRPSGLFIDEEDVLYSTDSESNARRNKGWLRGIYIGDAATGWVTTFIPDPEPNQDASGTSGAEGIAVDAHGNLYGAEVGPRQMRKYIRR